MCGFLRVCAPVHMHACVHTHTHTHTTNMHTHTHTQICTHTHTHTHTHTQKTCTQTCMHAHTHTHTTAVQSQLFPHSLVDRLTPIALSLTPRSRLTFQRGIWHQWKLGLLCYYLLSLFNKEETGLINTPTFMQSKIQASRSWSILWQFQSHAVAKPGFLTT